MTLRSTAVAVSLAVLLLLGMSVWRSGATGFVAPDSNSFSLAATPPDPASTPVLVELFTSEGCSSCPPADALLARLGRTQPVHGAEIIALEEHVDYWDRLGWKDPFSSEAATQRQNDYGSAFGGEQIYTPQMVVDGRIEFVGSSDTDALRAIRTASQAQKPAIHLFWDKNDALEIHIDANPGATQHDDRQLIVVIAENMLHSDVKRGENAGRALQHDGVVRKLLPVIKMEDASAGFTSLVPLPPARENLRPILFDLLPPVAPVDQLPPMQLVIHESELYRQ
jgi:hypothetical protein